ncbi:MAG: endonuclease/exonuclease/phosphatase family protein [Flavobacteriaceae bacterium]|nr:endonuclease/exonuclease/phosphatase family protein [Flavobacteriaceae bacterium]
MKKLNLIDKLIYLLNGIVAVVLLLAYLLPFVAPKTVSILSVLSLSVPVLLLLNVCFCLYWLLKVKKQLLLSLVVLLLGYDSLSALYKFSSVEKHTNTSLSVMSYNVRLFNIYDWIAAPSIENDIQQFVLNENADVVAFQEYHPHKDFNLASYPYKYESISGGKTKYGQAIFSKYKIVNKGEINFSNTENKAIYVDVLKGDDRIRIYNVHFESLHINPDVKNLSEQNTERLVKRIGERFEMQQEQAELVLKHQKECNYKKIILGDFNNTAYSYIYKQFKNEGYNDAFEIAGNGFGKTFDFKFFPLRIDFILVDENMGVAQFSNFTHKYSDHYPIKATISW